MNVERVKSLYKLLWIGKAIRVGYTSSDDVCDKTEDEVGLLPLIHGTETLNSLYPESIIWH